MAIMPCRNTKWGEVSGGTLGAGAMPAPTKSSKGETMWRAGGRSLQAEGAASAGALRRSMLGMESRCLANASSLFQVP